MSTPVLERPPGEVVPRRDDPFGEAAGGRHSAAADPPAFTVFVFWAFVLGGLVFGGVFLRNWQALLAQPAATNSLPAAGQVQIPRLGALPLPVIRAGGGESKPAPASGAAALVKQLLPQWSGTERLNILLLGIDKRLDEPVERTRSDTLMLVSVDPVAKAAAMVSIPRDLWVSIPGYGPQRINVAHAVGGPELAMRTITANFGIPVRNYARVDFRGFEDVVDTVGGVILDVDRPVKDDEYPTEEYGYQRLYIPPGLQLLDGRHALYYARSRHADNDFARAGRQQRVLVAIRDRALQLNMLPKAPELIGVVQRALSTDLTTVELLALARLGSEIERDQIANLVIDASYAEPFTGPDGADLLSPDIPAIRRAIEAALKSAAQPELQARLEVFNGTGRTGLGQVVADQLASRGWQVERIAVADRTDYRQTTVQVLGGARKAAEAVAAALRLPADAVKEIPTASPSADVRVIIGQDFQVP